MSSGDPTEPRFWRDGLLPFIEARSIRDGRHTCYGKHAHETFSVGFVTHGRCTYLNGQTRQPVRAGTIVLMNPGDVHACNPSHDQRWSYCMFYVDVAWLTGIQQELGVSSNGYFRPFLTTASTQPELYTQLRQLHNVLTDQHADSLKKHSAVLSTMTAVQETLSSPLPSLQLRNPRLERAAEFIRENYAHPLKMEDICSAADLSPSYLIRAFKNRYGLTPHAYLTNCRIEFSRSELRRGRPIAEVANAAGFCDQAHMQRSFKKLVAATPGQYLS
jgi:AraC-like DNA-binding protein